MAYKQLTFPPSDQEQSVSFLGGQRLNIRALFLFAVSLLCTFQTVSAVLTGPDSADTFAMLATPVTQSHPAAPHTLHFSPSDSEYVYLFV